MLTSLSFAAASLLLFSAVAPVKADDQWTATAPVKHGKSDWSSSDEWSHRPKQWSGEWQPQHWSSKDWHSTHWPSNNWSGRKEWSTNQWSTSEWSHREKKDGWSGADDWSHDGWSNTHSDKWSGEWDGRDGHGRDGHGKDGQWSHKEWNDHHGANQWSEDWPSHRPSHHEWSSQGWDDKKGGHHQEWSDSWSRQSSPDDPPVCPSIEFEYFITPLAVKFTALCDTEMNWADVHINVLNKGEAPYPHAPVEDNTWQWNYRMEQIKQNKFRFEFTTGANGMNFDPETQFLQFFFTYSPEQEHSDCNTQSFIFHPKKH